LDRPKEKEVPMAMLALVGAALHASLSEWSTGTHKKNTFSADAFLDAYSKHITLLTGIKQKNVNGYHTMMHRLYNAASGQQPVISLVTANAGAALAAVDFDNMDVD
ncbi:hypothetical protein BD414DRAFT_426509, partial [Trametes punicea]